MMIGNGWMGRGGVLLSVLALPGCGFIFGDDAEGGGTGTGPTDDPYPMPEEEPGTPEEAFDEECVRTQRGVLPPASSSMDRR
jgi:hypothetical protein